MRDLVVKVPTGQGIGKGEDAHAFHGGDHLPGDELVFGDVMQPTPQEPIHAFELPEDRRVMAIDPFEGYSLGLATLDPAFGVIVRLLMDGKHDAISIHVLHFLHRTTTIAHRYLAP